MLEWGGGFCDKCIAVVGAPVVFDLASVCGGIGIFTQINSKSLPYKLPEMCFETVRDDQ
jgi:hypothetical protein